MSTSSSPLHLHSSNTSLGPCRVYRQALARCHGKLRVRKRDASGHQVCVRLHEGKQKALHTGDDDLPRLLVYRIDARRYRKIEIQTGQGDKGHGIKELRLSANGFRIVLEPLCMLRFLAESPIERLK